MDFLLPSSHKNSTQPPRGRHAPHRQGLLRNQQLDRHSVAGWGVGGSLPDLKHFQKMASHELPLSFLRIHLHCHNVT